MNAPTNVLVADLKTGCQAFVNWDAPAGTPQGYYVYKSSALNGTYLKQNFVPVTGTTFTIHNLNLSDIIYVKVSAVDENGNETALSSAGDDAQIETTVEVDLIGDARLGDSIVEGAYFGAIMNNNGVVILQVADGFTFDGVVTLWELDADNYVQYRTDTIVVVLDGQTVAEIDQQGWYIRGYKNILTVPGAVADDTDAPFEWDAVTNVLWFIHTTASDVRLVGVDIDGNLYLVEHDAQWIPTLGAVSLYGVVESGNELIFGNGYYRIASIDRDELQLLVRGRIVENFPFT